jgi:hypothetical protein
MGPTSVLHGAVTLTDAARSNRYVLFEPIFCKPVFSVCLRKKCGSNKADLHRIAYTLLYLKVNIA